ncbi:MAG: sigma-70 family RNA polymerase sigma factor [Solirubrobacteraceae bacterium MAG38_C4-C5]|nr:sigma-70 family RNA polymerase sigma factor [Candidatus Siliceabacter maunaloa]
MGDDERSRADAQLLRDSAREPAAFARFYERHEDVVLLFLLRRTDDPELAADLTAETFAQALMSAERFRSGPAPAVAWLIGIARNVLAMSRRRGRVEDAARRRLGMQPLVLDDEALERVAEVEGDNRMLELVAALPPDLRDAVVARVVHERDYRDIALQLRCSQSVVRKRVSRGLARLRSELGGDHDETA